MKYPKVWINKKYTTISHVLYEKFVGKIPKGMYMLHKCDDPRCVNPNHLYPGSQYDNRWDVVHKDKPELRNFHRVELYSEEEMNDLMDAVLKQEKDQNS